jgi:hypothetical protein
MPVYWHNRIGLPPPPRDDARPDFLESTLGALPGIALERRAKGAGLST